MGLRTVVAHDLPDLVLDRRAISHGPTISDSASAETVARMARSVRYEKTLKPECQATRCCVTQ